jgi:hypothetical protein
MSERPSAEDDARFSEIVEREFCEYWQPPPDPTPPPPIESEGPEPFVLNLYDDEESYRQVPPRQFHGLGRAAQLGLGLLAFGVIGLALLFGGVALPRPVGWLIGLSLMAAAAVGIRQLLRRADADDDDAAVV